MPSASLVLGEARFADPILSRIERTAGSRAAWETGLASVTNREQAVELVSKARGHFAVALPTGSGNWLLAVDRFSVFTLCHCVTDGELHVSERADALAGVRTELLDQSLQDYLIQHSIASPHTAFDNVARLPPAHLAWFSNGCIQVERYWKPEFKELHSPGFGVLKKQFLELLEQSVARALDRSAPACFLSGGTDSSTVAGMIRKVTGRAASSWSIGFEAAGYDEMEYARIAAKAFSTDHHEYYVTPRDLLEGIPLYAKSLDQPFGNSSSLPAYWCARKARETGVSRLLAGDGGDELFGGNSRYAKQKVFRVFEELPAPVRSLLRTAFSPRSPTAHIPLLRKGVSYVEQADVPMPARDNFYNLFLRMGGEQILTAGFRSRVDERLTTAVRTEVWNQTTPAASELNKNLAYDWRFTLAESDLPKVRSACQLAGVEVTFPLLDQELVDFSLTLPARFKLKGQQLRWFFKEALRGFLPDAIITKSKQGFGLPFGVWCVKHADLGKFASHSVQGLVQRGLLRPDFVKELFGKQLPAFPGFYGEMVWILMMLEQWLQHHAPTWNVRHQG